MIWYTDLSDFAEENPDVAKKLDSSSIEEFYRVDWNLIPKPLKCFETSGIILQELDVYTGKRY